MDNSPRTWRYNALFGVLILLTAALMGQQALMIHDTGAACSTLALAQESVDIPIPARRGEIFLRTRFGRAVPPVAVSQMAPSCFVDPPRADDDSLPDVAVEIGKALDMEPRQIQEIIVSRRDMSYRWLKKDITAPEIEALGALDMPPNMTMEQVEQFAPQVAEILKLDLDKVKEGLAERRQSHFAWVKRQITPAQAEALETTIKENDIHGFGLLYEWKRSYPLGATAGSIIGFVRKDGSPGEGIEAMLNKELGGVDGLRQCRVDSGRRPVSEIRTVAPVDGANVVLTIDQYIQRTLEQAVSDCMTKFPSDWIAGVVMDPNTGEILATCSTPGFDPNQYSTLKPEQRKLHVFIDPYEPGSAFKPFIAAAAVDDTTLGVTWDTPFNGENGHYQTSNGGIIRDAPGESFGVIPLFKAIIYSSNVCMAKLGEKCGNAWLFKTVQMFGFGSRVPLQMPRDMRWGGGSAGIVTPLGSMDGYSLRRVPFGQQISVTAIQLANAYCALVNGGELLEPRLVDSVIGPDKKVLWHSERKVVRRVIRPQTSRSTTDVLRQVVEQGTGKACQMEKWTSFGKTGTAQIAKNGIYPDRAFTATFVGGAPATKPQLIVVISAHWPHTSQHYGAQVAAPYVKDVLEKSLSYLEVPPDKDQLEKPSPRGTRSPAPRSGRN